MQTFRILSLDGGGIKGAFTAAFLASMERHLTKPIGAYFDLIAGTSTGGISAGRNGVVSCSSTREKSPCNASPRTRQRERSGPVEELEEAIVLRPFRINIPFFRGRMKAC